MRFARSAVALRKEFGHIDRHGNKHVRVLLVEAVWRLLKYQPQWHARVKYLPKLKHGASLKKKIAVALARQLAIDLWRASPDVLHALALRLVWRR